jgi:hypothetical protein
MLEKSRFCDCVIAQHAPPETDLTVWLSVSSYDLLSRPRFADRVCRSAVNSKG